MAAMFPSSWRSPAAGVSLLSRSINHPGSGHTHLCDFIAYPLRLHSALRGADEYPCVAPLPMTLRADPYVLQPHEGAVPDVGYTRLRLARSQGRCTRTCLASTDYTYRACRRTQGAAQPSAENQRRVAAAAATTAVKGPVVLLYLRFRPGTSSMRDR